MVTTRSNSGMKVKHNKGDVVTLPCYFKIKGFKMSSLEKCRMKLNSNRSATGVKDGRPFRKIGSKWIYVAR